MNQEMKDEDVFDQMNDDYDEVIFKKKVLFKISFFRISEE